MDGIFRFLSPIKLSRSTSLCYSEYPDGSSKEFTVSVRLDTPVEVEYYRNGGILHTVLRQLASVQNRHLEGANGVEVMASGDVRFIFVLMKRT